MIEHQDESSVTLFDNWYTHYFDVLNELDRRDCHIRRVEQNVENVKKANLRLQEECNMLQKTQEQCQQQLTLLCDLEDELRSLKTKLLQKEQELCEQDNQNKKDIENLKVCLWKEYENNTVKLKSDYEGSITKLEKALCDEKTHKSDIESQLKEALRDKDREIFKITMEYESKLAQAERQKAQLMQKQQQVVNQDVMRRKMQHMKETHEKELTLLNARISELQQHLQLKETKNAEGQNGPQQQLWHQQPNDASPGRNRGRVWSKPNSKNRSMSMTKRSF